MTTSHDLENTTHRREMRVICFVVFIICATLALVVWLGVWNARHAHITNRDQIHDKVEVCDRLVEGADRTLCLQQV